MIPELKRLLRIFFSRHKVQDPNLHFSKLTALSSLLSSLFNLRVKYFVFSLEDPWPFFQDMANVAKKILALTIKKLSCYFK
jgi:hypothetical protein